MPTRVWFYEPSRSDMLGQAICLATGGRVSHVGIEAEGMLIEAHFRVGVTSRPVAEVIGTNDSGHWHCITLPIELSADAIAWLRNQVGQHYDTLGAVTIVLPFPFDNPRNFYCSELVARALQLSGLITLPEGITPADLLDYLQNKFQVTL